MTLPNPGHIAQGKSHRHWVDAIRVATIGLVVFHHALALNGAPYGPFSQLLTLLRVPLFFMLSGFLLSETTLAEGFVALVRKYLHSLVVPYFLLGAASWAAWSFKLAWIDHAAVPLDGLVRSFASLFYGVDGPGHELAFNEAIWFLPCLTLLHFSYYFLRRHLAGYRARLAVAAVLGFAGQLLVRYQQNLPPWNLDLVLVVMPFYALGQVARERAWLERLCEDRGRRIAIALCAGIGLVALYEASGPIDINMRLLGNPVGLYLGGTAGFLFMVMAAVALPASQSLRRLARNNLTVLCLHIPALLYAGSLVHHFLRAQVEAHHASPAYSAMLAVVAMITCGLLGELLRRYLPFVVGVRREPAAAIGAPGGVAAPRPAQAGEQEPHRHAA